MNSPAQDNPCPACTIPCDARTIDGEAGCVTPTPDENRCVAADGAVYVATIPLVLNSTGSKRCSKDCEAYDYCLETPPCHSEFRKDKRNIVWKREAGK